MHRSTQVPVADLAVRAPPGHPGALSGLAFYASDRGPVLLEHPVPPPCLLLLAGSFFHVGLAVAAARFRWGWVRVVAGVASRHFDGGAAASGFEGGGSLRVSRAGFGVSSCAELV